MLTMTDPPIERDALARYCQRRFDWQQVSQPLVLPLDDEPHVATWVGYAQQAQRDGALAALQAHLVQLQFPVAAGMSETADYRLATRQGAHTAVMPSATGVSIAAPEQIELVLYAGVAGTLPIVVVGHRADFETLVQALRWRNEPEPIPASMGACMIAGFNNWDRIHSYQRRWQQANPQGSWAAELRALLPHKARYQDRFMLVSRGPYSAVTAEAVQMAAAGWLDASTQIRIAHEYTHYLTARLFGDMQNHMLDELLADYAGLMAAFGQFDVALFFRFLGLEQFPHFRPSGRMQNYRGTPPLADDDFERLQQVVYRAAHHVADFAQQRPLPDEQAKLTALLALSHFSLEELAGETAVSQLISIQNKLLSGQEVLFHGSNK